MGYKHTLYKQRFRRGLSVLHLWNKRRPMEITPPITETVLMSAQRPEILARLGSFCEIKFHDDAAKFVVVVLHKICLFKVKFGRN